MSQLSQLKVLFTILLVCFAITSATGPTAQIIFSKEPVDAGKRPEEVIIRFDGREWKIGYKQIAESESIKEYVLANESIDGWNELVTMQLFKAEPSPKLVGLMKDYMYKNAKKLCSKLHWKELVENDTNFIVEWDVDRCYADGTGEYTVERLMLGEDGLHRIMYAAKKKKTFERNKAKWLNIISDAIIERDKLQDK